MLGRRHGADNVAKWFSIARRDRSEARSIATLSRRHICMLYDAGQHQGVDYLPYVKSDSMRPSA
jgi:hypothetical protein